MPDPAFAIECLDLTRKFGDFTAVDGIELHVEKGELFGFLGPNGAGKTTTIRMLTTLIPMTRGHASVAGYDLVTQGGDVRSSIGVVPQQFALFDELTPMENLWYIGQLFGMDDDEIKRRSEELLERVTLFDKRHVVLHTPEILFMDEPTTGLDPQSRISLRELTRELNESGITIVYTTHDMAEADILCDRIAIMDHGRIIAMGTSEELKRDHGSGTVLELDVESANEKLAGDLRVMLGARDVSTHHHTVILHFESLEENGVERVTQLLNQRHLNVKGLRISEPSLEEVFINLTKKDLRD